MILWSRLLLIFAVNIITNAEISIDNDGGYKNIVIGITPELPFNIKSLLSQLEGLLQNTSAALRVASKKNVFFKELVFAIPRKYKDWLTNTQLLSAANYFRRPDIFITENDLFINPYTVQHGGCERPGLRIHVPREFLEISTREKEFSLVRQWAHYRYGVFDESGFLNDEVYPACYRIPGTDTIRVSDCTNKQAAYNFRENKMVDPDQFSGSCSPVPVTGQNEHVVSSIMTNINLPKIQYFCDNEEHLHNRIAPTKHNALCGEKSTWEIISRHPDLKIERKHSSNRKLSFKYILESDPSLILAVDSSKSMELNGRMDVVRNAFAYFIMYDLPHNSTIGIIDMKNNQSQPEMNNIQTMEDAERLIDIFPEAYGYGDICVHCTIQRVIEVLKLNINDMIVITATDIQNTWVDNIVTMLKSSRVALHVIYFQEKLRKPAFLDSVAKSSGGSFYHIAEAFPYGTSISSLTLLYEAFRSVYESFSWMNRNHVLVDQKTFSNNCSPKCFMSFPIDQSIEKFQVLITGPNFGNGLPILRDSIVLENEEQHITSQDRVYTLKSKIPAYLFTIESPEPKIWNLTFERKSQYNMPIVVIVRATNNKYGKILSMHSWISFDKRNDGEISRQPAIIIHSEIKRNNNPVIDAKAIAFIHQVSYNKETPLQLKDSGEGDPDITKNDGIFSRYLTNIKEAGYHSITTVAEKQSSKYHREITKARKKELNCCGSFISAEHAYDSGPFKRVTTYQSFFIKNEHANINYPPRKIVDLRVKKIEILKGDIMCYVLKWTSPGENYDDGKAYLYDLKVFSNRDDALNDFDNKYVLSIKMLNIQGPLLEPMEAGTIQTAYIELTNLTSGTYLIAMKTISHTGKSSVVSNLVEIIHIELTAQTLVSFHTFPGDETTEISTTNSTIIPLSSNVGLSIGLSCGILLLLIIIGIIIFIYCERYRKSKNATSQVCSQNAKKTESNDALCDSNGSGGERSISIISPINSWGAHSLISHYETLQKNKSIEMNSMMTVPENKETDSISYTSSKYSYDNKIDQHSIYDPIYFHHVKHQNELNYPYNHAYTPFNPIYTSSLRRYNNEEMLGIPDPSENASFYSYNSNKNLSRLKTDV